jgi:phage tail sheath protein FI
MITGYKHGTYGEIDRSVSKLPQNSDAVAVYVGTAPVNLVKGHEANINMPVQLFDLESAKRAVGYSDDFAKFTLCEAIKAHFDNPVGNVGPIIVINVLDPSKHKKSMQTTKSLTFVNKRAVIDGDTIVLDSLVLADKVVNVDYTVDYDFTKKQVILTDISTEGISGSINATYDEVDTTQVKAEDVIGDATAAGVYTGLGALGLVYTELNKVPTIVAAPGWSDTKAVYEAMVKATTKINGHWDAYVVADIPVKSTDTIDKALEFKTNNGYNVERSKVCWPQGQDRFGKIYHASTAYVWSMLQVDGSHGGVPMETPSNKETFLVKQYFGEGSTNKGFDQMTANRLNASGVSTFCYWGGRWALWGPHGAAYEYGKVTDNRTIFDNSMRMLMYISNQFQIDHALQIDSPMNRAMVDTILNAEQAKLDALVAKGALIGSPVIFFKESENSTTQLVEGDFVWGFEGTPAPPLKSATLRVAYSDEGFSSFFGEV